MAGTTWTSRRIILLGAVVCVGAGILAATALANLPLEGAPMVDVPYGRLGDEFSFATFHRGMGSPADMGVGFEAPGARLEGIDYYRLADLKEDLATDGGNRTYAVLWHNETRSMPTPPADFNASDPLPRFNSPIGLMPLGTVFHYLDPTHGDQLRTDGGGSTRFDEAPSPIVGIGFQGKRLRVGDSLPAGLLTWERDCARESGGGWFDELEMREAAASRTRVDRAGTIDGQAAVAVVTTIVFSGTRTAGELPVHVSLNATMWFANGAPYPLQVECKGEQTGSGRPDGGPLRQAGSGNTTFTLKDRVQTRLSFTGGTGTELAWGRLPIIRESVPPAERSPPSATYPADGTGVNLPYLLSEAIGDAENASAGESFRAWKAAHPEARLAGADYSESNRTPEWRLLFGGPGGEGFELHLSRASEAPEPVVTVIGNRTIDGLDLFSLAQGPVTIAAVLERWSRVEDARPNALSWGYQPWFLSPGFDEGTCELSQSYSPVPFAHERDAQTLTVRAWYATDCDSPTGFTIRLREAAFSPATGDFTTWNEQSFAEYAAPSVWPPATLEATDILPPGFQIPRPEVAAVATASLAAILVTVYLAPLIKYGATRVFVLFPGYSKLHKDRLLDNRIRDQLVDAITNDPGVSVTDLRRRVAAGWGTLIHHLAVLERNGFVSSLSDGRHRRFFPMGTIDWSKRGQIALLKNERARSVLEIVMREPGAIQEGVAERIGLSRAATIWHLERLEAHGLVGRVKKGRKVHYYANEGSAAVDSDALENGIEVQ